MLKSMFQVECLAFVLEFDENDQKMVGINSKGEEEAVSEKNPAITDVCNNAFDSTQHTANNQQQQKPIFRYHF